MTTRDHEGPGLRKATKIGKVAQHLKRGVRCPVFVAVQFVHDFWISSVYIELSGISGSYLTNSDHDPQSGTLNLNLLQPCGTVGNCRHTRIELGSS